jgi:isopenicillin-N epimerase
VDLADLECDFYGGNCHKWLLAPTGSGFLYLGRGQENAVQPLQASWGWHHDRTRADDRDEFGSTPRLRFLEFEGVRDPCAWLAIPAAIDFQAKLGLSAIRTRISELAAYVRKRLDGVAGLELATPATPALHGAMTAFYLPADVDTQELRHGLWNGHRIEAPVIERPEGLRMPVSGKSPGERYPAHRLIRVSTHFYNKENEIDRLAEALAELLV